MRTRHGGTGGITTTRLRVRRLLLTLLAPAVLLLGVVSVPTPAYADGLDDLCKTVPAPVRPDYQVAGLVMDKPGHWWQQPTLKHAPGPDLSAVPDIASDPFKDPKVPIADVYGWAWRYTNYDLGCGNDFIRDPSAVVSTNTANVVMAALATLTSTIASVENMAHASAFGWLKPVVGTIGGTLQDRVLTVWLPLALLLLSVVVGFGAARASYAESFRRLQIVLVSIVLAVVSLVFPAKAADLMDQAASTVAAAAQAGFSDRASDVITRESVYKTWLVGNFGSADSPTATVYGPRLMSAVTYTWSDVKRMQANPGVKTAIDKAKGTEYKKIADEVKQKDPAAYQSLTGKTDTRTAATLLGLVFVLIMGFFVALAALVTVLARLIMIALVVAAMLGSVVGLVHFAALQRLWDLFTAAVLNTAKFTVASGVMTLVLGAIANAPVGTGWRLLIAVVVTVIAVMMTKPVASFKAMAGMDPGHSMMSGLLRRATGTALGVVVGQKLTDHDPSPQEPATGPQTNPAKPSPNWTQTWTAPVEPTMPPLLPPPSQRALPVSTYRQQTIAAGWVGAETFSETGQARPALGPAATPPWELPGPVVMRPRALPPGTVTAAGHGSVAGGAVQPSISGGPASQEQTRLPAARQPAAGTPGAIPVAGTAALGGLVVVAPVAVALGGNPAPPVDDAAASPRPLVTAVGPMGAAASEGLVQPAAFTPPPVAVGQAATGLPGAAGPAATAMSSPAPETAPRGAVPGAGVVYPTGIIVQPEAGLYRSGQRSTHRDDDEEYLRFPEPQVDANGEETWAPMYHTRVGG